MKTLSVGSKCQICKAPVIRVNGHPSMVDAEPVEGGIWKLTRDGTKIIVGRELRGGKGYQRHRCE